MILNEDSTYYDLLDVAPDVSPQELRAAYLRAKSTYRKDSPALYTLISEEETAGLLQKVEEAYQILSNTEKRREYDRRHGFLSVEEEMRSEPRPRSSSFSNQKIISIDRVPPMEQGLSDADILVPPTTDFPTENSVNKFQGSRPATGLSHFQPEAPAPSRNEAPKTTEIIGIDIFQEVEWRGHTLRKVREARKISLEEVADFTKISKSYIAAIEEENYPRLPAPVYLRGFITQVTKFLKLPSEKVASAYMARYYQTIAGKKT